MFKLKILNKVMWTLQSINGSTKNLLSDRQKSNIQTSRRRSKPGREQKWTDIDTWTNPQRQVVASLSSKKGSDESTYVHCATNSKQRKLYNSITSTAIFSKLRFGLRSLWFSARIFKHLNSLHAYHDQNWMQLWCNIDSHFTGDPFIQFRWKSTRGFLFYRR